MVDLNPGQEGPGRMWDSNKQRQLDDLREQAMHRALLPEEQKQLDGLLHELEECEWTALRPGLEAQRYEQQQLQAELDQVHAQNEALAVLADRYADLLDRAKAQLAALMRERDALREEYDRVLR
jgi:uncharacterized coiled-coil DUF342 family protein